MIARIGTKLLGLSGPVLAWAAVAAGTVIVALLATVAVQARVIQGKSEDIGFEKARVEQAVQAAVNNEQAVIEVAARLRACVEERKASQDAERKANAELERRQEELSQAAEDERTAREEIYATDDDCAEWRAAAVCPAIADRMRQRAARTDGSHRGGAGRDADEGPGRPH